MHLECGFWIAPNWLWIGKMTRTSEFASLTSLAIFWRCHVSLLKLRYWSKFYVNINTGSGIVTIFINKGMTRNLEIWNTPVWVTHIHGLALSVKEGLLFAWALSLENFANSYLCFLPALLHWVSYFFSSMDQALNLYAVFDSISSNRDEDLMIRLSQINPDG